MLHETFKIGENLSDGYYATVTTYVPHILENDCTRPAIVVLPGGAYAYCSPRESERIAVAYASAGFCAFVVDYKATPSLHPTPVKAASEAIKHVRKNAEKYNVNPDQIAVIGFSAGGHLAASISTLWNDEEIFTKEEIASEINKPNASILAYPVITAGEFAHRGSFENLLGKDAPQEEVEKLSLENRVGEHTPPTFLWHTFTDTAVPVENSLLYAMALSKYNIPCEMHIYPEGPHGIARVSHETLWSVNSYRRKYDWLTESVEWLIDLFNLKNQ